MQENKKKIAVFISSGIGDTILLVPLLKKLKEKQTNHISLVLNPVFVDKDFLIFNNFPCDEIITYNNNNLWKLSYFHYFDQAYLEYSNSSIKNLILASFISKKIYSYSKKHIPLPGIKYIKPKHNVHAAILFANMLDKNLTESNFTLDLMHLFPNATTIDKFNNIKKQGYKIIAAQISSGNNETEYKNWPVKYWIELLNKILNNYPEFYIILLGDKNEISKGKEISDKVNNDRLFSYIGDTTLREASNLLYRSDVYLGLDSAFMHLAVAYNKPTFTILGASSEQFIGYHKFDNKNHFVIYKNLSCRPCHTLVNANTSKVTNPSHCLDLECLYGLHPVQVFEKFQKFVKLNLN